MRFSAFSLFILLVTVAATAQETPSPQVISPPETQESVSLTIYNQNFAVVREVRPIALREGLNIVRFEGVAALIDPTSIAIKSRTAPGSLVVREQNYQYDLIGTQSVLDAAVGERIQLIRRLGDNVVVETGVLLSQPGQGRIVRLDDGRVLVDPQGEIVLMSMPDGLVSRPSLLWHLNARRGGTHQTEVSYMTDGIGWKANYVAIVSEDESQVDLTGWVTLDNQSGAGYRNAQLQLMAGEVRRVQQQPTPPYARAQMMAEAAVMDKTFEEESFFEYHLYTLDGATTIANRETKQMTLLSANSVGVRRRLIFDQQAPWAAFQRRRPGSGSATTEVSAAIVVELDNTEANKMGMPLPAGLVRVYKADRTGNLQFLGEDTINHTPRGEKVRLYIGDAFDVVGTRRVVREQRLSDRLREQTIEIEVRNRKETAADIAVVEHLWGDWTITEKSHDFNTLDARSFEFPLRLAPNETVTVRYTARIQY